MSFSLSGFRTVVTLSQIKLSPDVLSIREAYVDEFGAAPEDRGGWYPRDDWQRISFVLDAIGRHGRFLDVGVGAGQFVNAVARAHRFDEIHGLDRIRFNKYLELDDGIVRHEGSIADLPFPDDHFDVVTCMEVLEHLPEDAYEVGIAELRRVCRGQLLMSVPYEEPEPIFRGHNRRYEFAELRRDFPDAELVCLGRQTMPWALMEEWCGSGENPQRLRLAACEAAMREIPRGQPPTSALRRVARRLPAPAASVLRRGRAAVRR
ncbi:MAG: class I SAM-dependent methyltransferase [Actinomycetota bacterium]